MIQFDSKNSCDLIMGFSLDLLIDFLNTNIINIKINRNSIGTISASNQYAFHHYFRTQEDEVLMHSPHGINVIDKQIVEIVAWGSASLRNGTSTHIFKLAHHYNVNYTESSPPLKKAAINLNYNGTEIMVVDGAILEEIPIKMLRQIIQTEIKSITLPPIEIEDPSINIPFADTAVDFKRLRVFNKQNTNNKIQLCFDAKLNGQSIPLGQFNNYNCNVFDLKRTHTTKKRDYPVCLTIQGRKLDHENSSTSSLGTALNIHETYDKKQVYASIGSNSESEAKKYAEIAKAKARHVYNGVQTVINPILERCGATMKTVEEVEEIVNDNTQKAFQDSKPNYVVLYNIRDLEPINITTEFVGISLEAETNSFCLKFNYIFEDITDNPSKKVETSGFVYPYGLGLMVSENLINKIYQAYWKHSPILPKTFNMDKNALSELNQDEVSWLYSLNITRSRFLINKSKLQTAILIETETEGNKKGNRETSEYINNPEIESLNVPTPPTKPDNKLPNGLATTAINISKDNEVTLTIGKMDLNKQSDLFAEFSNLPKTVLNNITNIYSGHKINLFNLPAEFSVSGVDYNIQYNSVNAGNSKIIIGSKLDSIQKSDISIKPQLPQPKNMPNTNCIVPKDKWGYEGIAKGQFNIPIGISVKKVYGSNLIFVVDRDNNRIHKFSIKGKCLQTWGSAGVDDGQFNYPLSLDADESGNIYVADARNNRIQKFDVEGTFIEKFGAESKGNDNLFFPQGVTVDKIGNIYVSDSNHFIQKFKPDFKLVKKWGGAGNTSAKFLSPRGIALDAKECLYVVDSGNHRIQKFNTNGKFIMKFGTKGSNEGEFFYPQSIAIDIEENIFITDTGNNRIQKFDPKGKFITTFSCEGSGSGQLAAPWGIALDETGNIFVADAFNNRIQKFGP